MIFVQKRALVLLWSAVCLLSAPMCHCFSASSMVSKVGSRSSLQATFQDSETITETATGDEKPSLSTLFPKNKQILKFVEPQTNVTVMLIGSMHYNPASINLVETTVEELAQSNQLGSVIIESCDIRWNKTQEMMDKKRQEREQKMGIDFSDNEDFIESNPNDKDFLGNEMRAAWEVATKYNRPTVLGDQRINVTMDALKFSLQDTAKDIFLGGPSGWKRSRDEIVENWKETVPISAGQPETEASKNGQGETQYLNAFAFFDPRLLISLPVSLVKYPLSFLVKDPVPVGTVFAILAFLNFYADGTTSTNFLDPSNFSLDELVATYTTTKEYPWTDYALSAGIAVLETVIFARLLLKPLLAERNEILAKSILDQCQLYANGKNGVSSPGIMGGLGGLGGFFQNLLPPQQAALSEEGPMYVPGSDPKSMLLAEQKSPTSTKSTNQNSEGKIIVAVLGMAHCNGVMKLLREQRV